ncbi:hypothetical protein OHA72_55870 [Dactylosporangium sp. NBC_01737]|uniref:hypothetical protein n=1 Tax=Dactylosporangium sp. NBC_01737 TaxID=2975959 RepID=UPI002E156F06|nr:hypothetical protein OHA72_55870 [Dactylosporangium sp. NBC_01737]
MNAGAGWPAAVYAAQTAASAAPRSHRCTDVPVRSQRSTTPATVAACASVSMR